MEQQIATMDSPDESKTYTDAEVFGTLNVVSAEKLGQKVLIALEKGLATLPALDDSRPVVDRMRTTYLESIDKFELYGRRNIFTLECNIPRNLRSTVARLYLNAIDVQALLNDDDETPVSPVVQRPTVAEEFSLDSTTPSLTDIEQIESNIEDLQQRRDALRQKKQSLETTVAELSATSRLGNEVLESLSTLKPHEPVLKLARELRETNAAAESCRSRLECQKRQRDDDDIDLDEMVPIQPMTSRPRKTVEEQREVNQDIKLNTLLEFKELLGE